MSIKKIDGELFEKMLRNGLKNITAAEKEINRLNVFPVADGDTGSNMRLTLENGIRCACSDENLNEYLRDLSRGMLLGARGNSGVILSQIFRGVYLELSQTDDANHTMLRNAFIRGYKVAYESVISPVEGTMLTVAREGIEAVRRKKVRDNTIEALLEDYITAMKVVLEKTPEMLPVLGEAGVIGSGGKGYITIIEGMLMYLRGEEPQTHAEQAKEQAAGQPEADFSLFNADSVFDKGYCTEFILQRMNGGAYCQDFDIARFKHELQRLGDSLALVEADGRIKVHIHTKKPAPVMAYAQKYGEFLSFKLENMCLQHSEYLRDKESAAATAEAEEKRAMMLGAAKNERKPLAVITVANGNGMAAQLKEFGCDCILDGGETMNTSAQEFVEAIEKLNADNIVILPNNPNIIMAAEQAVRLTGAKNVRILRSRSVMEGYYALAMDIPDCNDAELRISKMEGGIGSISTIAVSKAVRDFEKGGIRCSAGEWIAFVDGSASAASADMMQAVLSALESIDGVDDKDVCMICIGRNASIDADELAERINEVYPLLECSALGGGQGIYDLILGIA